MGMMKEAYMDLAEHGLVYADSRSVEEWRDRIGQKHARVLDGLPFEHPFVTRRGETVPVPAIPIPVARAVGALLPDTHDELGWMVECFEDLWRDQ
jgi:hypothetical protein